MIGKLYHLVGIGGVGMAGLAILLKARGERVSGCDLKRTPRTDYLESLGIRVQIGHSAAHLEGVDEVIVTPAVDEKNPERHPEGRRVRFRGEVLAELASGRETIAVAGSHGKTTTATWTAKLLLALGEDVAWAIGGETGNFPVARDGKGPLVVEADESDGTLALYRVRTLVLNRLDYDHPDHFRTPADYFALFDRARAQADDVVESESLSPIAALDPLLAPLAPHNRKNARAAVEVALRRGHPLAQILTVLPAIVSTLPDRRFQRLAEGVVADYAHHPTEMACAVRMARAVTKGTLRVLFQPHRPSRTKALLDSFPAAFEGADEVILCPTYMAFEPAIEGGDIADLYRVCRGRVKGRLFLARNLDEAWEHVLNSERPGDFALLLGAGDVIRLAEKIPATYPRTRPPRRTLFIGAGSNTWKSDLNLSVRYVTTSGPAGASGATLGIPWMAGIPGTIGGWIKMNAGAFGHSISEVLDAVKVDGRWIDASACGFGYRTSALEGEISDYRLNAAALAAARQIGSAADFLARRKRFPAGTFGSFFKNPSGDFAGRLLEAAGAKDLSVGGAFVWREHANVIVRGADATPSDVLALSRLMRNRVLFRFGVLLESEVKGVED